MSKENPEIPSNVGNILQLTKAFVRGVPIVDEEWKEAQDIVLEDLDTLLKVEEFRPIGPEPDPCRGTIILKYIEPFDVTEK